MLSTLNNLNNYPKSFQDSNIFENVANIPPLFSNIMDSAFDYIGLFDQNFNLVDCSKSCFSLLKKRDCRKEFAIGKNFNEFIPDFSKRRLFDEFKSANDNNGYYEKSNFPLHNPQLYSFTHYVRFKMLQRNSIIIYAAEDITINFQFEILKQKYLKELTRNEQLKKKSSALTFETSNTKNLALHSLKNNFDLPELLEHDHELTAREVEIAILITSGKTTSEIADILYLSSKTIDFHRMNIRKKLGLTNTKQLLIDSLNHLQI